MHLHDVLKCTYTFCCQVFGASVHYQTVDMSVPDRGFGEWYESYWEPAVLAEAAGDDDDGDDVVVTRPSLMA